MAATRTKHKSIFHIYLDNLRGHLFPKHLTIVFQYTGIRLNLLFSDCKSGYCGLKKLFFSFKKVKFK